MRERNTNQPSLACPQASTRNQSPLGLLASTHHPGQCLWIFKYISRDRNKQPPSNGLDETLARDRVNGGTVNVSPMECIIPLPCFKYILLIMLLQLSHFFLPFIPLRCVPPLPPSFPLTLAHVHPLVVHISSSASPFPILFLIFPLSILYLPFMLLVPCTFSPIISPSPLYS